MKSMSANIFVENGAVPYHDAVSSLAADPQHRDRLNLLQERLHDALQGVVDALAAQLADSEGERRYQRDAASMARCDLQRVRGASTKSQQSTSRRRDLALQILLAALHDTEETGSGSPTGATPRYPLIVELLRSVSD